MYLSSVENFQTTFSSFVGCKSGKDVPSQVFTPQTAWEEEGKTENCFVREAGGVNYKMHISGQRGS